MNHKKALIKYGFYSFILIAVGVLLGPSFLANIRFMFSSEYSNFIIHGRWDIAIIYIVIFSVFLLFLIKHPLKRNSWKTHSMYIAFFIALFTEMFGFPLSVYFLSSFLKLPAPSTKPVELFSSSILGFNYSLDINSFFGFVISALAFILIAAGWKKIYKAEGLVTDGIYRYTRNPQYLGIILLVTVWAIVWPALILLIMWPVLCFFYYKLAKDEEKHLEKTFGEKFLEYKKKVPMFLPNIFK